MKLHILAVMVLTGMLIPFTVYGVYETEPNDSWEQANVIGIDDLGEGYASTEWNVDYWAFTIPEDGDVSIFIEGATEDVYARIFDTDGLTMFMSNSGPTATVYKNKLRAGTYFLEVNAYYFSFPTEYTFSITYTAAGLENDAEPNDSYATATILTSGQSVEGHINFFSGGFYDTFDIYKIETEGDGRLQVTLEPDEAVFLFVTIVDGDAATTLASGNDDIFFAQEVPNAAKGTYYLLVNTYYTFDATGYTLGVQLFPPAYANDIEVNDDITMAQSFAPNATTTGHLGYELLSTTDLIDWFAITIPYEGDLTVSLTNDRPTDVWVSLFDTDQLTLIQQATGTTDVTVGFTDKPAGTYYVATNMYYMSEYCSYTLSNIYETDVVSVDEISDKFAEVSIFPNPASNLAHIVLPSVPTLPLTLQVFNANGTVVDSPGADGLQGQYLPLNTAQLPAGMYTIRILDAGGNLYAGTIMVLR